MSQRDDPYKIVQKVGDNTCKIEPLSKMNISFTFNVGDITPYIEDEDKSTKNLRTNPPSGEVDAKQATKSNLLNHIEALAQIQHMVIYENGI